MRFWNRFRRNPGAVIGLLVLSAICGAALLAPLFYPGSPWQMAGTPFLPPGESAAFPLGTDMLGRNIAAGTLYGARVSLMVGLASTVLACGIGILFGALAGYYGGWMDDLLMRVTEFFQILPSFVVAVVLVAILSPSLSAVIGAIAVISWPPVARLVRSEFLALRAREFVQAALVIGQSNTRIITTQILPNALPPIIVMASLMVATAILLESGLSFLGLGDPSQMSWGFMIGAARPMLRQAWWMSFFPGVAILLTVLAINLVGEGLNDAFNPRSARKGRA
ncbi:MAG TPA: ABC transporter permease [Alphaproteobacteria bacterium]|nr:ABC transporter permease [Alphaproteobacteria bacterium]